MKWSKTLSIAIIKLRAVKKVSSTENSLVLFHHGAVAVQRKYYSDSGSYRIQVVFNKSQQFLLFNIFIKTFLFDYVPASFMV